MKIQAGKRYLRADGSITGVIEYNNDDTKNTHKYRDNFTSYRENGLYSYISESSLDLIAEVPEHLLEKLVRDILEFNGLNPVTPFEDMDDKEV